MVQKVLKATNFSKIPASHRLSHVKAGGDVKQLGKSRRWIDFGRPLTHFTREGRRRRFGWSNRRRGIVT